MGEAVATHQNVVLLSPTGSGKTLGYLIPLCRQLNPEMLLPQAIVIVPSRELAQQSEAVFQSLKSECKSIALYGGRAAMEEHRKLNDTLPQILFATPGRLLDHLNKDNFDASQVKCLVLDEFDKCLELGFQEQLGEIVERLQGVEQCLLTSATDAVEIPQFMERVGTQKKVIRLSFLEENKELAGRILQYAVPSPRKDKLETLGKLLSKLKSKSSIVFVAHRESADRVGNYLRSAGFCAEIYHGGLEQERRERSLFKFRSGSYNILVATDLAARGLDIPEVKAVIHYHLPADEATATHRNGRTARWDEEGNVYYLIGAEETLPDFIEGAQEERVEEEKIQPALPVWTTLYIGRGKKDKLSKGDIAGFICKKGGLKMEEIGRIDLTPHHSYAAILRSRLKFFLNNIRGEKIKGMKTLIEEMRN